MKYLALFIFLLLSCAKSSMEPQPSKCDNYQKVFVADLCQWYNERDVIVHDSFHGACLHLLGRIERIVDNTTDVQVYLSSYGINFCDEVFGGEVQCAFQGDANSVNMRSLLSRYNKNDFVGIYGKFSREDYVVGKKYILYADSIQSSHHSMSNECGIAGGQWKCDSPTNRCDRFYYWFLPRKGNKRLYVSYSNAHWEDHAPYYPRYYFYELMDDCKILTLVDTNGVVAESYAIQRLSNDEMVLKGATGISLSLTR